MELIEKKENKLSFTAKISENLANALRRYINQILILAVNDVEISKNDSPLYDETIAHRIGLIPLKTEKGVDKKTTAKLKLSSKKEGEVYSKELQGSIKVAYDKIPITLLNKGQELELTANVRAGKGEEHSKFSPGLMFYRNLVRIKLDKKCSQKIIEICPKKIFKLKDGKLIIEDEFKCDMCNACVDFCKKEGGNIDIIPKEELLITIESFGQMDVGDIFKESIGVLKKDLTEVAKKLGK